jgi:beta-lactamase class A
MAATTTGNGYWLVAADGGIFSFGDAHFHGSAGNLHLGEPVVGMAATPSGHGYWLVAADGGIFSFGDAHFHGSMGGARLVAPIVGMAATTTGNGYWLVAADGGIFTFGDAHFHGSAGNLHLGEPVVGMAATPTGNGYWIVEQSPPDLFSPALVASLNARAGVISASVLDLTTRIAYQYRPGRLAITASIVKVEILGTLLADAQASGRSLTPTERALATAMIEQSDNGAATTLWDEVGGAPAVHAFDDEVGMTSTTPNVVWGLTTTTAADQVILLQRLVQPNAVLSNASRAYELGLMERVTPSQAWGVSAGVAPGTTVALKNGFEPVGSGATVTSIGWVDGYGRNYLIAVTTSGDPTESYGIDSISEVATAAWDALEH